jgi:hypothetical protein
MSYRTSEASGAGGEAPPAQKSFPARALGVLLSPTSAFEEIAVRPDFLGPLMVLIVGAIAVAEIMLWKIGMAQIIRNSLQVSGRARSLTPDQMDQAVRRGAAIAGILAHLGAVLGPPIFLALAAGVGLLILNGIFGVRASFKPVFSVTCYADLPAVIGDLMAIAMILFGDPSRFNPQSPIPTNPGFFLDPLTTPRALYSLAGSLDLLTFWFLALLAVGLARVSRGQVKARSIFLAYLAVWLVLVLGKAGLAMMTS